ncbi:hypothetical protein, partial [Arthrobacter alkaliphilus]
RTPFQLVAAQRKPGRALASLPFHPRATGQPNDTVNLWLAAGGSRPAPGYCGMGGPPQPTT